MNWDAAIEINRTALLRLLTGMFAVVGMEAGGSVSVIPLRARLLVLRILRPAESALRRIVLLRARAMADEVYVPRPAREKTAKRGKGTGSKSVAFPLFDPRKKQRGKGRRRPNGPGPRISFFDGTDSRYQPEPEAPKPGLDDDVCAARLCRRLNAMFKALNDLDAQAKRLKRQEARRKMTPRLKLQGVVRINTPPGHRERGRSADERDVDEILSECQTLARRWIRENDTS